jgi:hypothetical protein
MILKIKIPKKSKYNIIFALPFFPGAFSFSWKYHLPDYFYAFYLWLLLHQLRTRDRPEYPEDL